MKVEVSKTPKVFEPITLTITIETREELLDMWARHTVGNHIIYKVFKEGETTRGVPDADIIAACEKTPDQPPILVELRHLVESL